MDGELRSRLPRALTPSTLTAGLPHHRRSYLAWTVLGPGRRAAATGSWRPRLRRAPLFNHLADYFPARLHKTADLDPDKKYLFAFAPHGLVGTSVWCCFATKAAGFSQLFPGIDVRIGESSVAVRLCIACSAAPAGCLLGLHCRGCIEAHRASTLLSPARPAHDTLARVCMCLKPTLSPAPSNAMPAGTIRWNFYTPLAREALLGFGFFCADRHDCLRMLEHRSILLVLGGAAEALHTERGCYDLVLKKRWVQYVCSLCVS